MLHVTIYDATGKVTARFDQEHDSDFDYVSFINTETHGPPPLVAPFKGTPPVAKVEDRVLYINTGLHGPPMFAIERISD